MLTKFFDTLANMGIWIRLNDKRTEPPTEEGRVWGPPLSGFALSLDSRGDEGVSILIKNLTDTERHARIPNWLHFLKLEITAPDGSPAPLKLYGKQALSDPNLARLVERVFPPGKAVATDIPIAALYDLRASGPYRVRVTCPVPDSPELPPLVSNEINVLQSN